MPPWIMHAVMGLLPRPPAAPALVVDLARIVGSGSVSSMEVDRAAYARDAWVHAQMAAAEGRLEAAPDVVVWPESVEDLSRVLRFAESQALSVVPVGALSGQSGGVRQEGGIALDLKRLDAIRRLEPENLRVEVEAGCLGARLEAHVAERGLTLGHRPASNAFSTVGGWVATRCLGGSSPGYGGMESLVHGLESVTPGRIRRQRRGSRPLDGPDFNSLLLGSEGALAVITAAEFRLRPRPEARRGRAFRFESLAPALDTVRRLFRENLRPTAFDLFDGLHTWLLRAYLERGQEGLEAVVEPLMGRLEGDGSLGRGILRRVLRQALSTPRIGRLKVVPDACLLILRFEGATADVEARVRAAEALCRREGGVEEPRHLAERWERSGAHFSHARGRWQRSGLFVDDFDTWSSWDRVLPLYRNLRRELARDTWVMGRFSRGGPDGCGLDFTFGALAQDPHRPSAARARHARAVRSATASCLEGGGSSSHFRGIGAARSAGFRRELGEGGRALLGAAKRAFDPRGILNPDRLVPGARSEAAELKLQNRRSLPPTLSPVLGHQNIQRAQDSSARAQPPDENALAALLRVAGPGGTPVASDQTGFRPPVGAVQLDLGRLDGVRRISELNLLVEVEAGVVVKRLERVLWGHGLTLGAVHPRAEARSVGAGVSRNLLIRRSTALGELSDMCAGFRALLPDGTAIEWRPGQGGPRWDRLFIGGHGRLGVLTKLSLRVAVRSEHHVDVRFGFPERALAISSAQRMLQRGVRPAAGRILSNGEGHRLALSLSSSSAELLRAAEAVCSSAVSGVGETSDEEISPFGGRFDAVVEVAQKWSEVEATWSDLEAAGAREVWADFLTADGLTLVARLGAPESRGGLVQAGMARGGRIVAGLRSRSPLDEESFATLEQSEERSGGPFDDVLERMCSNLDPTAILRDRGA